MKRCSVCGLIKPREQFALKEYNHNTGTRKIRSQCKPCWSRIKSAKPSKKARLKAYFQTDKGKAAKAKCDNEARSRHGVIIASMKEQGCVVCGYSKCAASLHCHHLDPSEKEYAVNNIKKIDTLVRELSKCVVLCANCHGELHAGMIDDPALMVVREQGKVGDEELKQLTLPTPTGGTGSPNGASILSARAHRNAIFES